MAITDAWLKANNKKPQESVIEKTDRDGLSARVTKKGRIVFQLRFRFSKKQHRLDIGTYPLISLKKAREQALKFKADIELGNDPRITKKIVIQSKVEALTLKDVFNKWYESYCVHNKRNHCEINRTFELYVFPSLGDMPPDRITLDMWITLLEHVAKNTPSIADRILTNSKQMMAWSVRRKLINSNILFEISSKQDLNIVSKPGTRSLDSDEIKMLMYAVKDSRTAEKNKLFIKLCLIYGCRNGELRLAMKKDFDFNNMVWTIPAENHKTGVKSGKPLIRPITSETKQLFDRCLLLSGKGEYVFNNGDSNDPMGRNSPGSLPYNLMQWLRKNVHYNMQHWSIHDLRKTARTNFSTITQPHIAEIMLGHKLPGEWQTYDMHDYLSEQANCIDLWIERIKSICGDDCL